MKTHSFTLSIITFLALWLFPTSGFADPVAWHAEMKGVDTQSSYLEITASIAPGYHLYAPSNPPGGATPLSIQLENVHGFTIVGTPRANKKHSVSYNDVFETDEHYFTGKVAFIQKVTPTSEAFSFTLEIKGQTCKDEKCERVYFDKEIKGKWKVPVKETSDETTPLAETMDQPSDEIATTALASDTIAPQAAASKQELWANVENEISQYGNSANGDTEGILFIFLAGFAGGLLALLTPCVWPMIPMTVSYFLKRGNQKRKRQIGEACMYGASIVIIYVVLGLLVTIIFGASALNSLATNAIFNIIFFLILVIFAISFLGGFELTLPASWSNKMDSRMGTTTGFVSIFFMAFTLALVSFSCTGPIIGTLLVEAAASGSYLSPAIGMTGFALALALPFALFAMFPSWLKAMPKSGGWLNSVKVVLGFLELALALKFLSVADMAYGWRILDREVFVALWITLFTLLGMYLLGKITFSHDTKTEKIGVFRFMLACVSISFAIYMLPGLWGAPLKAISAFTPPATTQDFSLYDGEVHPQTADYDEAMELAARTGKPVLVDFSGYGCVNCRKMESAVWTNPSVKSKIDNDFILVTLMVDDKQSLPFPMQVVEKDGKIRTLRTVGDKWSYLQRTKFGANAQPYHVILGPDGKPLASPYSYNENPEAYLKWLNTVKM